jgi:hypothetical protein
MPKSYYSTVFDHSADTVWAMLRDFNNYAVFIDGVSDSHIENGKTGDAVGAVRHVTLGERHIRQQLLAHSDVERSYSYNFCAPSPLPVTDYVAQIRVTPVTDDDRAFVEWWATFDCAPAEAEHHRTHYAQSFAVWTASLRRTLDEQKKAAA